MIYIFAVTDDPRADWYAVGWTRETAEENYKAASHFYSRPLYRIIAQPRPVR